jgi:hypothetical protein
VPPPGEIAGVTIGWQVEAGPLGRHAPAWAGLVNRVNCVE